jgi:hypothetical protein
MQNRKTLVIALAAVLTGRMAAAQSPTAQPTFHPASQATELDLAAPFHARSPWRLVVTEGPPVKDYGDNDAPGALSFCLRKGATGPCISDPVTIPLRTASPDHGQAWEPHYLLRAKVVYPRGQTGAPLLLIVTGSLNSGDGDQIVATQLIRYDPARDAFRRVFAQSTGHNNNQEIRFVTDGPLMGSVITAEPQEQRPYGYWIVVNKATPTGVYHPVLRYRSATTYNDGNSLAVIDSEMPNIELRLGLWKPGAPLPIPSLASGKRCLKPALKHGELWCG